MARPSSSINVLEGGRSVWAEADIVFPFQDHFRERPNEFREMRLSLNGFCSAQISGRKKGLSHGTMAPTSDIQAVGVEA
jgi:hypothetical protein